MTLVGRRNLWRLLAGKLFAGLALFSYALNGIGLPLPATHVKDHSVPFPCQDHSCGCGSAEQCWRHCCCFTVQERWAWAQTHDVEPPAYAEQLCGEETHPDHGSQVRCCHDHRNHAVSKSQSASGILPRWILSFSVLQCRGLATLWISSGAVAPPPPVTTWSPCLLPSGWVWSPDISPITEVVCPLDPPPRWPCS
jgi:hypothetical protein